MKKYYRKLVVSIVGSLIVVGVIWAINSGVLVGRKKNNASGLLLSEQTANAMALAEMEKNRQELLVLYSPQMDMSIKSAGDIKKISHHLKMGCDLVDARRQDTMSLYDYDVTAIATAQSEKEIDSQRAKRLMNYMKKGGRLLIGTVSEELGDAFAGIYRKIGIQDYEDFRTANSFEYMEEPAPGMKQVKFSEEEFEDTAPSVQFTGDSRVHIQRWETKEEKTRKTPVFWICDYGEGRIDVFNGTIMTGDYWSGTTVESIVSLYDIYMHPVINTKTIFLDDFPPSQYNSESDVMKERYNRMVKELYRDIWWLDMQATAKLYSCSYTGLFVATYNDTVSPEQLEYELDRLEQYYGNSLMKNDHEIGVHGYNHQSLGLKRQIPRKLGYRPRVDTTDMAASLEGLNIITEKLLPGASLQVCVLSSSYLSPEGREVVVVALPDLKMVSGVYTMEGEEGAVYVQDFAISPDGIVEFPRISSGMLDRSSDRFSITNGLGLYGVFSHFIYSGDTFDEDRGAGLTWQELYKSYSDTLNMVHEQYQGLRPLTASQAADALKVAEKLELSLAVEGERVIGKVNGFYGEAYCSLKTERMSFANNDSCVITPVCDDYRGDYYVIEVKKPEFPFYLEDKS